MKVKAIQKIGRLAILSAAFAAAAASPVMAQQPPQHSANYATVAREVGTLSDIGNQISMTQHTAAINNERVDQDAMKELRASLKQEADAVGPKIILTSGLTGTEIQTLIDQFKQSAGTLPDYLAKVNGKAKLVDVCQQYLVTPDGVYDKAHAEQVADCVASKQVVDPGTDALPVQQQPVTQQPVTTQQTLPQPVEQQPVTAPVAKTPAANGNLPLEIGGAAAGVIVLGAGAVLLTRRKKKPADDAAPQTPAAAAPPPPPEPQQPLAPKTDAAPAAQAPKMDVFKKPIELTPPPPQTGTNDDTAPSKKPRKFDI